MTLVNIAGWTPFRAAWLGEEMVVDWCHLGARRLVEPFFYETVARAFTEPFNQLFQRRTPADALEALPPGLKPTGFIFHMSRCGSTLCAQALAADPANIVVSEGAPIRNMLQAPIYGPASPERVARRLRGIVNAYSQPRFAYERRFFVKFMAADVLDLPLILETFPDVPWIFLHREPLEVLASLRALGGADSMRGAIPPERLGLTSAELEGLSPEAYLCHVMAAFGRAALAAHRPGRSLIIDYADLRSVLTDRLPAHFGFDLDAAERGALEGVLGRDSKRPSVTFEDRSAQRRAAATPFAALAEEIVGPTYAALKAAGRLDLSSLAS